MSIKKFNKFSWLTILSVIMLLITAAAPAWAAQTGGDDGTAEKAAVQSFIDDGATLRQEMRDLRAIATAQRAQPARASKAPVLRPVAAAQSQVSTQPAATTSATAPVETSAAVTVEAPATVAAQPISAPEAEHPVEVSFKGSIESLSGDTLMVAGQTVVKNAQTIVQGTLAVGAFVEVEGTLQSNNSVLAKSITVEHNGGEDVGEVEFRAPIVSAPSAAPWLGTWVVGDYTVVADGTTVIDVSRATPAVGVIAEVKATQKADGTLHADKIKTEDAAEFQNEAEFKGTISGLTGGPVNYDMQVGDRHVTTDNKTQIVGTLANGALVEVLGSVQSDSSVLASRIQVEDAGAQANEKEFRSTIATLPAGFIGTWTFSNGESVVADANTVIDESRGPAQVGALAQVQAFKQGAQWVAVRIQIEND